MANNTPNKRRRAWYEARRKNIWDDISIKTPFAYDLLDLKHEDGAFSFGWRVSGSEYFFTQRRSKTPITHFKKRSMI